MVRCGDVGPWSSELRPLYPVSKLTGNTLVSHNNRCGLLCGGPTHDLGPWRTVLVADARDIAAVDPPLELPTSLQCSGTLSGRTWPQVLKATKTLLARWPPTVTIDVSDLYVADVDGANTFARLQRMGRKEEVELRRVGLEFGLPRGPRPWGLPTRGSQGAAMQPQRCVRRSHHHPATQPPMA